MGRRPGIQAAWRHRPPVHAGVTLDRPARKPGRDNCTASEEVPMSTASVRERLRAVVEPPVAGLGYDLEDVVVTPAGKRRLVRVVVDRDGGVSLDQVADVSRAVSEALDDDEDVLGGAAYVL